jgi:hypothetical protein
MGSVHTNCLLTLLSSTRQVGGQFVVPMEQPWHAFTGAGQQPLRSPTYTHPDQLTQGCTQTQPAYGRVAEPTAHFFEPPPIEITTSPPATTRRGKKQKQKMQNETGRGPSYTIDEDRALCSAYVNVGRDPIVGANQNSATYWERIANFFHDRSTCATRRSPTSLTDRWGTISYETSRFCSYLAEQERRRESGKTASDRVHLRLH